MRTALLVLLVAASACKKSHATCDKSVDMMEQCDSSDLGSGDEHDQALDLLRSMCREAYRDDARSVPPESRQLVLEGYAEIRKRAECVAHAKTCDDYKACTATKTH